MNKAVLFIFISIISLSLNAQKPLATFFSEDGYNFRVILDGKEINAEPQSRVEFIELDNDWAQVKIIFENRELPPVEKRISGVDADGKASSITWVIKENSKGKWQIKASSWKTLEEAEKEQATSYKTNEVTTHPAATATTTTTETTTITATHPEHSEVSINTNETNMNMDININEGQENANVNINMSVPVSVSAHTESHTTYTTTVTTTTENATTSTKETYTPDPLPGYNGRIGCDYPMGESMFTEARKSIESKDFEDTKLTVAKQVMNSNCLLTSQVKQVMQLFDFEDTRLEFAKAAFDHVYDIDNYYLVNDAFDFESSIDELNDYISR
ncbi:MAG: DUF4476 domain-containing protein [Bacteroidales bacterium]